MDMADAGSTTDIDPRGLDPSQVVDRVDELLEVTYRSGDLGNLDDVLSETVYVLLSLNTREAVYQSVFSCLRSTYPRWADVAAADLAQLEEVLRPGGLQSQRSQYLHALLRVVAEDNRRRGVGPWHGDDDLSLEYLHEMADTEAEQFLVSLPGVGKKTARCVMAYALNRHTFAVDTHVARIFDRLGLISKREKPLG